MSGILQFFTNLVSFKGETLTDVYEFEEIDTNKPLQVGSGSKTIKIVSISDTHLSFPEKVPKGDVLIHCGDFLKFNSTIQHLEEFNNWLGMQDFKEKVVICGNHEVLMKNWTKDQMREKLSNATHFLHGETCTLECGLTIFGSPITHARGFIYFANAFSFSPQVLEDEFSKIPENVDIVVTHVPPLGILDFTHARTRVGSSALLKNLLRARPKVHFCGHNHDEPGAVMLEDILIVNTATTITVVDVTI